jgi:hypothetical protein
MQVGRILRPPPIADFHHGIPQPLAIMNCKDAVCHAVAIIHVEALKRKSKQVQNFNIPALCARRYDG